MLAVRHIAFILNQLLSPIRLRWVELITPRVWVLLVFAGTSTGLTGCETTPADVTSYQEIVKAAENQAPESSAHALFVMEDTAEEGLLEATDPDGDSLTYLLSSEPSQGTITWIDADAGTYVYTPSANAVGTDEFRFFVNDGYDLTEETVTVTISEVDDEPVIGEIEDVVIQEGSSATFSFTIDEGGGSDEDIQVLTLSASSSNTTILPNSGITLNYTDSTSDATTASVSLVPDSNESGELSVTLYLSDGESTVSKTFQVEVAENDAPTIGTISNQSINEDASITGLAFTVDEGGDSDEDAQSLTVTATSSNTTLIPNAAITVNYTADGSADATGGTLNIVPVANLSGSAIITVTVVDNGAGARSAQTTFTVTVASVNDAPTISSITNQTTAEDTAITGIAFTVDEGGGTDEDAQGLTVTATSSNQSVVADGDITVSYVADNAIDATGGTLDIDPVAEANGTAVITVEVNDGTTTATTTFTLTVTAVNDAPTLQGINGLPIADQSTAEDTPTAAIVLDVDEGGGTDENAQTLTISATSSDQTLVPNANIVITYTGDGANDAPNGSMVITPAANQSGSVTILVTVFDSGTGNLTVQDSFILTVTGGNDAPTIAAISNQTTAEDTAITGIAFTVDEGGGTDEDAQGLTVTATSSNQSIVADGDIDVNYVADNAADATGGTLDITPIANATGTATITVEVDDGATTTQTTFTLTVTSVNDTPTVSPDDNEHTCIVNAACNISVSLAVDEGGASDEDVQNVSVTASSSATGVIANGSLSVCSAENDSLTDATTCTLTISQTPTSIGSATITATVSDGTATAQTTVKVYVWDSNFTTWLARKKITIDNSTQAGNLTNFPVMVKLNSTRIDYAKTENSGEDLRFTDANGTLLDHEIENWDEAGTSVVWVEAPSITGGANSDYIWMYYHKVGAVDGQNATGVWNSEFESVWHLDDAMAAADSTSHGHATSLEGGGSLTTGKAYQGLNLDSGFGHGLRSSASADYNLSAGGGTIEGWFNLDSLFNASSTQSQTLFHKYFDDSSNAAIVLVGTDYDPNNDVGIPDGALVFKIENSGKFTYVWTTQVAWAANTWIHFAAVADFSDSRNNKIYINGVADTSSSMSRFGNPTLNYNADLYFGHGGMGSLDSADLNAGTRWDGVIDEVRFSSSIRNADWIKATYQSINDTFLSYGSEESQ